MDKLTEIAKNKLEEMGGIINPHYSIIPQLMQTVFGPGMEDNLALSMEDRQWLEEDLYDLQWKSDQEVIDYLVPDPEMREEQAMELERMTTLDDLQDFLILNLLSLARWEDND